MPYGEPEPTRGKPLNDGIRCRRDEDEASTDDSELLTLLSPDEPRWRWLLSFRRRDV